MSTSRDRRPTGAARIEGASEACAWLRYAAIGDVGADAIVSLPSVDHDRAAQSARAVRREQYLAGRVLLRTMLEELTGRPGADHEIRATARGRPECAGGPTFSVSHSGGWVACALASGGALGVDVQVPVPGRRVADIARQYFAPAESDWVAVNPERRFYMLWVLKEAYLKALGLGFAGGLRSLECRLDPPAIDIVAAPSPAASIELRLYVLGDAFVGLASTAGPLGEIAVRRFGRSADRRWLPGRLALVAATPR